MTLILLKKVLVKKDLIKFLKVSLLLALLMSSGLSQAKEVLTIVINKGGDNPVSVGIVPFKWKAFRKLPINVSQIIEENLKLSGLFDPFDKKDMLSHPHTIDEVVVKDWRLLGVQYLVIGSVVKNPDKKGSYVVSFEMFDVTSGQSLLKQVSKGSKLDVIANSISDKIYHRLTGVQGFFSTKLAYLTTEWQEDGKRVYRLREADANGRKVRTMLTSREPIMSPSWSPDGKFLTYVSFQNDRPNIFMQERKTGIQTVLTSFPGINGAPDWSPDGKKLAMVLSKDGNAEIYVMDVSSKKLQRMTKHWGIDTEPRWAPDGKSIIFTSSRGGSPQIYRLDVASRKVKRLTFGGKYNARGQLTPDGKNLVYVHQNKKDYHIAVLNLDKGYIKMLSKTRLDESPSIAPNGSMIVYATVADGVSVLRMVTIDGNIEMQVPAAQGELREPAWSPFMR